jgi:hypothetical protein
LAPVATLDELEQAIRDVTRGRNPNEVPLEDAAKLVGPAVEDAVARLVEYVVPYFREVAGLAATTGGP